MTAAQFAALITARPLVVDGGWGTELQRLGLGVGIAPEKWNLDAPDNVRKVAAAYVDAGADIILTNTFGGCSIKLKDYGLEGQAHEINRRATELSKEAAGQRAQVFASIGPCGKLVLMGDVDEDELETSFSKQAEALAEGGADGIVIETMADLEEASIALAAARKTGLPVVVSLVYDSGAEGDRTMMGVSPEQAGERLAEEGASALGANCGQGIDGFVPLVRKMGAASSLPVWAKPNAGLPEVVDGKVHYRQTPLDFAAKTQELLRAGAKFVGGCCGTNPAFIAAIRQSIEAASHP